MKTNIEYRETRPGDTCSFCGDKAHVNTITTTRKIAVKTLTRICNDCLEELGHLHESHEEEG
jgi:hypothetical protein